MFLISSCSANVFRPAFDLDASPFPWPSTAFFLGKVRICKSPWARIPHVANFQGCSIFPIKEQLAQKAEIKETAAGLSKLGYPSFDCWHESGSLPRSLFSPSVSPANTSTPVYGRRTAFSSHLLFIRDPEEIGEIWFAQKLAVRRLIS